MGERPWICKQDACCLDLPSSSSPPHENNSIHGRWPLFLEYYTLTHPEGQLCRQWPWSSSLSKMCFSLGLWQGLWDIGLNCIFFSHFLTNFTQSYFSFLILDPFFHVKSRLQPCRYWLFDQAWESAQSWKDKLAASCWPIATNQSHHRKRLIVSMPCSPQQSH